ncbi:MAG: glycosyltransferase [Deltaproteobacteria bacterium]|nr:glycosyltransferase [Deltaproteobacteria bacterium]
MNAESIELSVVIPTRNEAGNIAAAVRETTRVCERMGARFEVVVVDAGSADGTGQIAAEAGARVVTQVRPGYGGAIVDGFETAHGEFVLTMDADLSHPPEFIPRLWRERDGADLVIASRYVPGGFAEMPFDRYLLSKVLNAFFSITLAFPVRDQSSGFRLYRRDAVPLGDLTGADFSLLQDLLIRMHNAGRRIREVPFYYRPRVAGSSNARVFAFGISYLRTFARHWRRRHGPDAADCEFRGASSLNPVRRALLAKRYATIREAVDGCEKILIAGSGSSVFAATYPGVTALDLNEAKVRFLAGRGANAVCADARAMPFADGAFDAVVATWMVAMASGRGALAECARVLAPGGVFVVHVPDARGLTWRMIAALRAWTPLRVTMPDDMAAPDIDALARELDGFGVRVERTASLLGVECILVGRRSG